LPNTSPAPKLLRGPIQRIPLEQLDVSGQNVRKRSPTAGVPELAENLDEIGQQQPIVVQREGDRYRIVVGQRRYLAAKQLGWPALDAVVLDEPLSEVDRILVSLSENVQRRDLEPEDKSEAVGYLLRMLGSAKEVAHRIGVTERTVKKWLGYRAVPESIRQLVTENGLTVPAAIRIAASVDDEARALEIARHVTQFPTTSMERKRFLDALEDDSNRPLDEIQRQANEDRESVEITFVLPSRYARQIRWIARTSEREPSDVAREATIEWLESRDL
jgi:ParB family chromosome partitioning protein